MNWTIFIFSLFLLYRAGTSFILRLPCKKESDFGVIVKGRKLVNQLIAQTTVKTVNECYQRCEDHNRCRSVNYRGIGSDNCELNKKIRETSNESDFEVSDSWEYHATRYNTTNIGSYCDAYRPCPSMEYCLDTCSCPGYQCFRHEDGHKFIEDFPLGSCEVSYNQGHRSNGIYDGTTGSHYCVMEDVGCGPGGWTLAMKANGNSNKFNAESEYWTNNEVFNELSPSLLPDDDAKYPAFNSKSFSSICIGLKKFDTGITKWLPLFNVTASSLREIFGSGASTKTNVGRSNWMALMDNPRMQEHCNTDGLNLISLARVGVRIGFMANNENNCASSDSFIGIGISSFFYHVSTGYVGFNPKTGTSAMGYILIK